MELQIKIINSEIESLLKIKEKMNTDASFIWRFATGIGEQEDQSNFRIRLDFRRVSS